MPAHARDPLESQLLQDVAIDIEIVERLYNLCLKLLHVVYVKQQHLSEVPVSKCNEIDVCECVLRNK